MDEEVKKNSIIKPNEHHKRQNVCETRPAYRQGNKLTAVKVYTINDESRHLLVFGVPSINLINEVRTAFAKYGIVEYVEIVPDYPDIEEFTQVYHVHFVKIASARYAKKKLDDSSFFGGLLHICYAPELESIGETKLKLLNRKKHVEYQLQTLRERTRNKVV